MKRIFLGTLVLLFFFVGWVVFKTGVYKKVRISTATQGPFVLVYKEHSGAYHKIPPVISSVEKYFQSVGHPCTLAFGRYLDDPRQVEEGRLRSHGGCVFQNISMDLSKAIKKSQFTSEIIQKKGYVVASFRGSPSLGPLLVYSKVGKWLSKYNYEMSGPVIELYQSLPGGDMETRYLFSYEDQ